MDLSVMLPWNEFSEFFLEEYTLKQNRKWEELYATDQELDGYEGKSVVINYTYEDGDGHTSTIHWSFALDENKTIRTVSYTGSSSFAFWWCNFTDEVEDEEEAKEEEVISKCFYCYRVGAWYTCPANNPFSDEPCACGVTIKTQPGGVEIYA